MNALRCCGLLILVLLGGCDAQETPVPKPKTEAAAAPAASSADVAKKDVTKKTDTANDAEPSTQASAAETVLPKVPDSMHELMPGVPVVPVVVGKESNAPSSAQINKAPATGAGKPSSKAATSKAAVAKREATASNRKAGKEPKAKDVRIKSPKLDLSLPPELVRELDPPAKVITSKRKPLLPQMFGESAGASPFELEGRLLTNEMQLQMRNENRRDVEGAALDFKFKQ
ncbi:translation initiation factor 2 [Pseudomonas syringae]|uniref:Translation initiation factor 2 n=1 Tax=Pseudomonas syringae TaxID=317 RepID=A0A244ERA6_PSESX|nr:translation initiation factor 2 [Pseudomonas syringae]OUM07059.1 translation initiation factor 2 [Pseudomonas syringae]